MSNNVKVVHMYRIVCKDPLHKDCYIGSTENLPRRKNNHLNNCIKPDNKEYNKIVYQHIREHGGWDNWEVIEIEKYRAKDLEDRRRQERYWLEYYEASLNKNTPYVTKEESVERHREKMNKYYKNPENAERNRIRMKETMRKKRGYYDRRPSVSSIETEVDTDIDTRYDLIPDN